MNTALHQHAIGVVCWALSLHVVSWFNHTSVAMLLHAVQTLCGCLMESKTSTPRTA